MSDELTPAHGSALGLAIHAAMQNLGGSAALVGAQADDQVTPGKLARVGSEFVIIEQMANMAANLAHTFCVFRIGATEDERFRLSKERALFMLIDKRPKGWHVQVMTDPAGWWDDFMAAIHAALEPFAPKPN